MIAPLVWILISQQKNRALCYFMYCLWKISATHWHKITFLEKFTFFLLKWTVLHLNPLPYRKVTVCKINKREDKEETILHYAPLTSFPPLLSLSLHPLLPLFAALLTTVTAALITPLWSPRVAGTCHLLPRGAWVITSIHPRAVAPVPRSPWR